VTFQCNVCGEHVEALVDSLTRETGACPHCGANVRLRSIAYLVGLALHGTTKPTAEWPARPDLVGYGVSDWQLFSKYYRFAYKNTQFDPSTDPDHTFLDITKPPDDWSETADLISCSEVLEHVAPPVALAYQGLYRLLKPGGALILTVPYTFSSTVEHFPDLYDWALSAGNKKLNNVTRSGKVETFTGLCFHEGGTATLEMRVFGLDDIRKHLQHAGFTGIGIMDYDVLPYGIKYGLVSGRPIIARRPGQKAQLSPPSTILTTSIERALMSFRNESSNG
jgi:hypothetical protein